MLVEHPSQVTPDPTTPEGYAVRSAILDLVDIFEVNRKECARLLLELPKWLPPGTFKPRPGAPTQEAVPGKDWQLESTIIEVRSTLSGLKAPSHTTRRIFWEPCSLPRNHLTSPSTTLHLSQISASFRPRPSALLSGNPSADSTVCWPTVLTWKLPNVSLTGSLFI